MLTLVLLAVAVAAASTSLTKASITQPIRYYVQFRWHWLGKLLGCAYCASHWIAALAVALTGWPDVTGRPVADFIIVTFAVVGFSALVIGSMMRLLGMHEAEMARYSDVIMELHEQLAFAKRTATPSPETSHA